MDSKIYALDACNPTNGDVGSPSNSSATAMHSSVAPSVIASSEATLGRHLAYRLVEIGVNDVFSVPGDFNLTLFNHLITEPSLNLVDCCNELNAGCATDGYARYRGVGACVVTFTIDGLSVLNAIAEAYSKNLPLICIVGGPNSNDYGTNKILHHTIRLPDFSQELRCFPTVTCYQAIVNNLEDAHEMIDTAISTALKESKHSYISISYNLPGIPHPTFSRDPVPFAISPRLSNQMGLEATAEFLSKAVKPVLLDKNCLREQLDKNSSAEITKEEQLDRNNLARIAIERAAQQEQKLPKKSSSAETTRQEFSLRAAWQEQVGKNCHQEWLDKNSLAKILQDSGSAGIARHKLPRKVV
ncbi:pyruvate decarboxylase 1-like [Malania oleifera]|uniref:pyruvate decarboxylase 1-like n=1 Tax=Malania oleifera TaxID=397392 RepID=UPI0025AE2562|nr:pyruvate decarboxylase 1-like [Malania oleifera]